ncbi:hypothetical protein TEA_023003 [Camellia sinensis var. sinensis]|uniref:40S ribosomal protein S3 n=1 Tax=Camellia sinensis var. sinensis TaxID=542762 RepID=A0A4S4E8S6_CAMSN|nr:hypothetical protein TEA_023003 [Camellia sinensis var. sinensis]
MELYAEKVNNRDFVLLLRLSLSDTSSSEASLFGVVLYLLTLMLPSQTLTPILALDLKRMTLVMLLAFQTPTNPLDYSNPKLMSTQTNMALMLYSCGINAPGLMSLTVLSYLRACYGVFRFIMESGAKGCKVIVSGKLRAQHAKSMKFKDGYMISSGQPVNEYIDSAVRHVLLRQGLLGIKVKIMLDWDPKGKQGLVTPLPDLVTIHTPLEEEEHIRPAIMPTEIESPMA